MAFFRARPSPARSRPLGAASLHLRKSASDAAQGSEPPLLAVPLRPPLRRAVASLVVPVLLRALRETGGDPSRRDPSVEEETLAQRTLLAARAAFGFSGALGLEAALPQLLLDWLLQPAPSLAPSRGGRGGGGGAAFPLDSQRDSILIGVSVLEFIKDARALPLVAVKGEAAAAPNKHGLLQRILAALESQVEATKDEALAVGAALSASASNACAKAAAAVLAALGEDAIEEGWLILWLTDFLRRSSRRNAATTGGALDSLDSAGPTPRLHARAAALFGADGREGRFSSLPLLLLGLEESAESAKRAVAGEVERGASADVSRSVADETQTAALSEALVVASLRNFLQSRRLLESFILRLVLQRHWLRVQGNTEEAAEADLDCHALARVASLHRLWEAVAAVYTLGERQRQRTKREFGFVCRSASALPV